MNKTFLKIIIVLALLAGFGLFGRAYFYFPNDEVDSGLPTVEQINNTYATTTAIGLPERLIIPKLEIDADVQHLGVTTSGNMAAPNNFTDVSWYKLGTPPGADGSAVMAGHEDNAISLDGVFKHLEDLVVGDSVYVMDKDGNKLEFKVVDSKVYPYDNSPVEKIFNAKGKARLNLITCAGEWLPSAHTNDKRLVVYTELVK